LDDLGNVSGTYSTSTLTDRELGSVFDRDRGDQLNGHLYVIARHDHVSAFRQRDDTSYVSRTEVELRTVVRYERRMTSSFFLAQNVNLCLELCVRMYGTDLSQYLSTLNLITVYTTQQRTDVVAGFCEVQLLAEHFQTSDDSLTCFVDTNDFDFLTHLNNTT